MASPWTCDVPLRTLAVCSWDPGLGHSWVPSESAKGASEWREEMALHLGHQWSSSHFPSCGPGLHGGLRARLRWAPAGPSADSGLCLSEWKLLEPLPPGSPPTSESQESGVVKVPEDPKWAIAWMRKPRLRVGKGVPCPPAGPRQDWIQRPAAFRCQEPFTSPQPVLALTPPGHAGGEGWFLILGLLF